MAKPILDGSCVVAGIGQCVAAAVAQHVGVHREREPGALADALDEAIDSVGRERAAALSGEDKGAVGILPLQLAQRPHFVATERMRAGLPFLARRTCSVAERPRLDLRPFQIANLGCPQTVPKGIRISVASR